MAVEVVLSGGFKMASLPNSRVIDMDEKENCNRMWIQLGFRSNEPVRAKENGVFGVDSRKNVIERWPKPTNYSFYFIKHWPYDDLKIKNKLYLADKEIQESNHARIRIMDDLKAKRAQREVMSARLNFLRSKRIWFNASFNGKKNEWEPLQQALGELRTAVGGLCGEFLCSSENELNDLMRGVQYRVQHGNISMAEEKQLLKDMKQLEGMRGRVMANAAMRGNSQSFLGQKEVVQNQIMRMELSEVKKESQALLAKINRLSLKLNTLNIEIESLESELKVAMDEREKAYENIQALRRQRDEGDASFYRSRGLMMRATELAANGSIEDLEDLSNADVERFMVQWNGNKAFRARYEKRILPSLDARQLSRDGRIRNPEEKPLVFPEEPVVTVSKDSSERGKENHSECNDAPTEKAEKEQAKRVITYSESGSDQSDISVSDIPCEKPVMEEIVDEERLKEMKREEELEKAKRAMERKRKLQEKAAVKAAIRAQKEEEKKLKEREKKAKKKAAVSSSLSDHEEAREAVTKTPKPKTVQPEARVPVQGKPDRVAPRERSFRFRNRARGVESLPKAVLRRRKSVNYWGWALSGAALALVLLIVVLFYSRL